VSSSNDGISLLALLQLGALLLNRNPSPQKKMKKEINRTVNEVIKFFSASKSFFL
jgi:hypothetical protein